MLKNVKQLDLGNWAKLNPYTCPCRGRGWFFSEFKTWHKCPYHSSGAPHPEKENPETHFNFEDHLQKMALKAYLHFSAEARVAGFQGNFSKACAKVFIDQGIQKPRSQDWVETAAEISRQYCEKMA
jgi:hypothetical protein